MSFFRAQTVFDRKLPWVLTEEVGAAKNSVNTERLKCRTIIGCTCFRVHIKVLQVLR